MRLHSWLRIFFQYAVFKVRFVLQIVETCVNLRMDQIAQDGYSIRVEFSSCQGMVFVHASFLHRFLAHGVQKGLEARFRMGYCLP